MSQSVERMELERLRDAVGEIIGFAFEQDRLQQLGAAVRGRVAELGLSGLDDYVTRLRTVAHHAEELPVLAAMVTITETFFHRNYDQIRAFLESVVPERLAQNGRRLRVLSAGCASGEEPFTLAIALSEAFPDIQKWNLQILGVDVNRAMLEKARRGRYSAWSLRATPEPIKERYFERVGSEYQLSGAIMRMVELREENLADRGIWSFESFNADVIFCRNVIMYFGPEVMRRVVERITQTLAPGGYLFLGHAETLRGLSHDFELHHTHDTFYYQKRRDAGEQSGLFSPASERKQLAADPLSEVMNDATSWFETIQAASRRVAEIALAHGALSDKALPHSAPLSIQNPPHGLIEVLELIRRERFSEALALLEALPVDAGAHPDALLLSAVLLTNHGKIELAERACVRLLAVDNLNAGAHYLMALCREHAGDDAGAVEHDRIAAHLDPTFSMPRLHAGLLAKRTGDRLLARRELSEALVLLEREETARVVLFGGGFSRDALLALCQAEFSRLGEGVP